MNDRSVCLLDNYEIEVLRTYKGRGAILCETDQGILAFKEYSGYKEKALFQDGVLNLIREKGFLYAERILKNKEGELLTQDIDGTNYMLKTYAEGRECNVRDMGECRQAIGMLAAFHKAAHMEDRLPGAGMPRDARTEFEKHNRELKRVRKYLKERGQKSDFELYLQKTYDYFLNQALEIMEDLRQLPHAVEDGYVCHGDYQYHNIIFTDSAIHMVNFEKCAVESPVRDLYLFMRKLLEKNSWSQNVATELLNAYAKVRPMEKEEYAQLYYRMAYPEKFWKIVNFYYNSGKAWIPGKNLEKLQKVVDQEKGKQEFLENFRRNYIM